LQKLPAPSWLATNVSWGKEPWVSSTCHGHFASLATCGKEAHVRTAFRQRLQGTGYSKSAIPLSGLIRVNPTSTSLKKDHLSCCHRQSRSVDSVTYTPPSPQLLHRQASGPRVGAMAFKKHGRQYDLVLFGATGKDPNDMTSSFLRGSMEL
jgi:hypothetical protein